MVYYKRQICKTLFYPNGSSQVFPVNSRDDIMEILRSKAKNIVAVEIESNNGDFIVLARMDGDAGWIGVGSVNNMI